MLHTAIVSTPANTAPAKAQDTFTEAGLRYQPGLITDPDSLRLALWNGLNWINAAGNRREYYVNDNEGAPYTYGSGAGRRTYLPSPYSPEITAIKSAVEARLGVTFEACVLNGYADQKDSLGWHADDSPEVDPARPIAVVSLGAERNIMFRPIEESKRDQIATIKLQSGSLLVMPAGCQQHYLHRIPKADRTCGIRVSLTFRGYLSA